MQQSLMLVVMLVTQLMIFKINLIVKIYGFEPQKECIKKLKVRFKNKKNIEILNHALDNKTHKNIFMNTKMEIIYQDFIK